jgi:haloalkane dehalogenase
MKTIGSLLLILFSVTSFAASPGEDMPYPSQYIDVNGTSMHYVVGGSSKGPTFLFMHGNPSSSYLWRNVMPHLEQQGQVIAFDLVGFGQSGKPDIDYTFQAHYTYVEGFIKALGLKSVVLVLHDWGSALGLEYARNHSKNVLGVAMMEAIVPPRFPMDNYEAMGDFADTFRAFRTPETGRLMLIEQNIFVENILNEGALTRTLTEQEKDTYRAPFKDPKHREPVYVWPNELPIEGEPARNVVAINRIGQWLEKSKQPKLLLFATPGAIVSPEEAMWMQEHYRNLEAVYIGQGVHYIQEDQPEAIGRNILSWYLRRIK